MNWNNYDLIDVIEAFASDNNWIASEEALSDRFDEEVAPLIIAQYGENDQPAINQAFNNWTDSLREEGEIHSEQYNNYCYIGEYS